MWHVANMCRHVNLKIRFLLALQQLIRNSNSSSFHLIFRGFQSVILTEIFRITYLAGEKKFLCSGCKTKIPVFLPQSA